MSEIWKDVVGYEGRYQVSNLGQVKGIDRKDSAGRNSLSEKILIQSETRKGYLRVALTNSDGNTAKYSVHRLVLEAFVDPCPEGMEGCHNDGNPMNNRLDNLDWKSPQDNWNDRRKHGTASVGEKHPMATITEERVKTIKRQLAAGAIGKNLAIEHNVSVYVISQINTGKTWSHVNV